MCALNVIEEITDLLDEERCRSVLHDSDVTLVLKEDECIFMLRLDEFDALNIGRCDGEVKGNFTHLLLAREH